MPTAAPTDLLQSMKDCHALKASYEAAKDGLYTPKFAVNARYGLSVKSPPVYYSTPSSPAAFTVPDPSHYNRKVFEQDWELEDPETVSITHRLMPQQAQWAIDRVGGLMTAQALRLRASPSRSTDRELRIQKTYPAMPAEVGFDLDISLSLPRRISEFHDIQTDTRIAAFNFEYDASVTTFGSKVEKWMLDEAQAAVELALMKMMRKAARDVERWCVLKNEPVANAGMELYRSIDEFTKNMPPIFTDEGRKESERRQALGPDQYRFMPATISQRLVNNQQETYVQPPKPKKLEGQGEW